MEVGTILPMESLEIISVEQIILTTLDNISMNQVFKERQQNEVQNTNEYDDCRIEALNADSVRYCTIEQTNKAEQETNKEKINTEQKVEEDTDTTEEKSANKF